MSNWFSDKKDALLSKYRSSIREKAIANSKVAIALAGKRITDYDEDQLEVIVAAEEKKIVEKYRNSGFVVLLLALGLY